MLSRRHLLASGIAALGIGFTARLAGAEPAPTGRADLDGLPALRRKASNWLAGQQRDDGRLAPGDQFAVGITALGALALAAPGGLAPDHPVIRKALGFVRANRQGDGGFYDPQDGHALYGTSLALQLFAATGETAGVAEATAFVLGKQNTGDECGDGGFAAEGHGLPDLHATTAAIDGLVSGGLDPQDPHLQAARRFVERCQEGGYGGAVYSPDPRIVSGDHDTSGAGAPGRPEPYGAMTHAAIADLLVLGVAKDDPRVTAALGWIGRSWALDRHPGRPEGRGQEGLFGYYATVGKTCHLLGIDSIARPDGGAIDWRGELAAALRDRAQAQRVQGGAEGVCWRNGADRWGEAMPHLSTTYALRCLAWIEET